MISRDGGAVWMAPLRGLAVAAILVTGLAVRAATIIPPRTLAELARECDAVVLARAGASTPARSGIFFVTRTDFTVERTLAGGLAAGESFSVEALGGEVEGEMWVVPGSPRFAEGESYLLCLQRKPHGGWRPAMMAYGLLHETGGRDGSRLLVPLEEAAGMEALTRPDGAAVEPILASRKDELLDHLALVLAGEDPWDPRAAQEAVDYLLPDVSGGLLPGGGAAVPSGCVHFHQDAKSFRWQAFDSGGSATMFADSKGDPSLPGGGFAEVEEAMNVWMGIAGTSVNLVFGGPTEVSIDCVVGGAARDGVIVFGDPCSDLGNGILAVGGPRVAGFHDFDGTAWRTIVGWIIIVNDGSGSIGAENYVLMVAHEMGHGLGYGHTSDGSSLMFGTCCRAVNALDTMCARYTYPAADPANERPVVDAGGDRTLVLAGDTALLRGTVTDDGRPAVGRFTTTWRLLGGPGAVTFGDPAALETTVLFPRSGLYLLGLSAHDGALLRVDSARVDVRIVDLGSVAQATFQQRVGGYGGTVDTSIARSKPAASRGSEAQLRVDRDDPGGSGQSTQVLLRFDGIFGDAEGQVPPGAVIRGAWLDLDTDETGDGAALYRMMDGWTDTAAWNVFGGDGIQPGQEALGDLDGAVQSPAVGVTRLEVTRSVAAWSADPCANHGWAFLPLGDNGWVFSSSEGAQPPRLVIEPAGVRREQIVRVGDRWIYWKGRSGPPAGWSDVDLAPGSGWIAGPTGIGYGDGDDATVLSDMMGSYVSVYCRREITVRWADEISLLRLSIGYDDGFVAYLNGVEVARSASMGPPGSPVSRSTLAASRDAGLVEAYHLETSLLLEGKNVLAVEVHNSSLDSSNLSFLPELFAERLIIPGGAEWRYLKGSAPVPAGWNEVGFDDAAWESGPAGIGYGDGDDLTELGDMRGSYLSVFCRKAFEVAGPSAIRPLRLMVISDDGIVVYLNGVGVGRDNMPPGVVTPQTAASEDREAAEKAFDLPVSLLVAGTNVLAASVHNSDLDSSDLSFMAVLFPAPPEALPVSCSESFRRGDVSSDGALDIADAVRLLLHLFLGGPALVCKDAADFDDDGILNVSDVISVLGYLFQSGVPPASPGLKCGADSTADSLGGCSTAGCTP